MTTLRKAQIERYGGAFTHRAFYEESAIVQAQNLLRDGEAQTRTPGQAAVGALSFIKTIGDSSQVVRGNPGTCVFHENAHFSR